MAGTNSMVLQDRDRRLLAALATLRVMDHELAKVVGRFGSASRVNKRLLKLTRAGLLRRCFLGSGGGRKAIYSLSKKGAHIADVPFRGLQRPDGATLVADFFLEHQLAINEVYCAAKFGTRPDGVIFNRWLAFQEPIVPEIPLIPDGYLELGSTSGITAAFVEVDLGNESHSIWREKTRKYLQLAISGTYARLFGQDRFRVLVIANSQRRLDSLRKAIAATTDKIFRFASLADARAKFFLPIWTRPSSANFESLIDQLP